MAKKHWKDGLDDSAIEISASLDIKPKVKIESLGIDNAIVFTILSDYYTVVIPKEKAYGSNELLCLDVDFNGIECQFIAEAVSFRHQLQVIKKKQNWDYETNKDVIGHKFRVWKENAIVKNYGNAEVYHIQLLE
jgi:hypothetical protein